MDLCKKVDKRTLVIVVAVSGAALLIVVAILVATLSDNGGEGKDVENDDDYDNHLFGQIRIAQFEEGTTTAQPQQHIGQFEDPTAHRLHHMVQSVKQMVQSKRETRAHPQQHSVQYEEDAAPHPAQHMGR